MSPALIRRSTIGPYRVIDFVGAGGMGAVYRVMHRDTGRVAAAKVLNEAAVGGTGLERFRNEARIHQTLVHPNVARMFEYLEVDGLPCLIMEYVDGESLDDRVRREGPLSMAEALRIFAALAEGVAYVHKSGVVHRDLKTNNVRIAEDGTVKLLDFGIATSSGGPRLTSTGNVVGTLQSLAPEQLTTGRAEPRSDIWALGIVFYELLTGTSPFSANAPGLLGERILKGSYTPPSVLRAVVPRDVDRIIARCLRVRPDDRYPDVNALLDDVRRLTPNGAPSARLLPGWDLISEPSLLLGKSGEVARRASREWRLLLAAGSAFVMLVFLLATLRPTVTDDTTLPVDTTQGGGGRSGPLGGVRGMRRVTIRVLEGDAAVYRDGVQLGTTPYQLEAPIGTEFSLMLRRTGCDDTPIRLRITEGLDAVMESMRRCRAP
ncbi:MAG TPA: serine/threonine-protein kinase [Gemmatimonas sp.]|uniref:serine/threonine-protein kinase n=1 Tax=Gemmatimonas sp. TaxID=1962908 RepID=UPI002EDAD0F3